MDGAFLLTFGPVNQEINTIPIYWQSSVKFQQMDDLLDYMVIF